MYRFIKKEIFGYGNNSRNFVPCRGPKGELPKGEDGSYGTSMTMAHAMNEANDVILAYK